MRRKVGRGGADRRRMQSKNEGSDASDDDYKIEEDREIDDSDEYCSSLAEEELEDDLVEDVEEKKLRVTSRLKSRNGLPTKSRGRVGKACKGRKVSHKEDSDEDYLYDDDGVDEVEDSKDWGTGFPRRRRNGAKKVVKEKKASHMEDQNDDCEAEDDGDEDYNANEDGLDLWKVFPRRKRNVVQKPVRKKKSAYMEENDDAYKTEDDECSKDDDSDYSDDEDIKELRKCCPTRKHNGIQKVLKKKKDSSGEEDDDDYEAEDDDCDDCDDYVDIENEKDLPEECPTRNRVQKALKKTKVAYTEESDDDYEVENDECDDEDDYENEEVEEEDEDFASDEIDFGNEDEVVVKKAKKVRQAPSHGRVVSGGQKKRNNSRVIGKSKRKTPAKRRGFHREISASCHKEAVRKKSKLKEKNLRTSGPKRRRLVVDSDSDFVDEPLSVDEEYTISEEEKEQVQEASRFCGHQDVNLRNSSKKRSCKKANLPQERKHKARKGKDKVEESKNETAKQVCGICLSEEGRRTVQGTLDCCSHYFCFNCIMDWSKVESRCPLCKQRFATISKRAKSDTTSDLRITVISVPERDQVYQPSEEELRAYLDPYENVICTECHHGGDDANMLLCDLCDSPAHTYCVGLSEVPEGNWYCEGCRPTALGPSIPETPTFTNELVPRSFPSENIRVAIDLNRAYEPETPLGEGIGMSSSPRPVDGDLRAGSLTLGVGVQTVSERRRRHQMAHFTSRTGANVGLGPEVEWGRTRRLVFQNAARPNTSAFDTTFSQGLLRASENVGLGPDTSRFHPTFSQGFLHNFVSPAPSMHLLPTVPSNSGARRVWGQTFPGVSGSANGSGLFPAGLAGIRNGDAWSNYGHSPMQ